MPDSNQNRTAKSFSSMWTFSDCRTQEFSALLQNTLQEVSSCSYSMLQTVLLQSECVSSAIKLVNAKKLHKRGCVFCVVCFCILPFPPLGNCFLSGTLIETSFCTMLSAFFILQAQKQALLLEPDCCHSSAQTSPASPSSPGVGSQPLVRVCFPIHASF